MLSEIIKKKQQYINQNTITSVECGITCIGHSTKFKNILKLHLSGNKLVKLNGIEQFTQLQYLNLTNNLIEQIQEFAIVSQTLQCLFVTGNPFTTHLNYGFVLMNMFANLTQLDNEKINKLIAKEYNAKWQKYGFQLITSSSELPKGIFSNTQTTHLQKLIEVCDFIVEKNNFQQEVSELKSISQTLFRHICKFERANFSENSIQLFFTNQAMQSHGLDLNKFAEETGYYQEQITEAFMKYEENQLFPTFPLYKQYTLGLLDFIYQTSLTSKQTVRVQEDRIKPQTQERLIQTNHQNQIEVKKFDECTQEYLSNYKKLYPFLKGTQILSKTIKTNCFKIFKRQVSLKTSQLHDSCIKGVFKLEVWKKIYQKQLKKITFKVFCRSAKLTKVIDILQIQVNWQKLSSIKHISCLIYVQKKQAILKRDQYLKKLVLRALDPYTKFKKLAKKLKFKLLSYKINGELRQALKLIKIKALSFKMEVRKDLNFKLSFNKKNTRESGAIAKFKKLRDLENF